MNKQEKEKRLHGNSAKIDPQKHVESLYQSYRITQSDRRQDETPLVDDDDVAYGRSFVDENKK